MLCRKKLILLGQAFFSISILISISSASTIFDGDVEILKSDNSGVTLKYKVPSSSFTPFEQGNNKYHSLNIERTAQNRVEGQSIIPIKIVPLALPPGATAKIQVIDANYKDAEFKKLPPFFARSSKEEYDKAYEDASLKSTVTHSDPYIVSFDNLRGLKIARIGIPAIRYSENPPSLSMLQTITLRVDFVGGQSNLPVSFQHPGNAFNKIFSKVVANYDVGANWVAKEQKIALGASATSSVFDSASTWFRMELTTEGIYSIGWNQFRSLGIANPDVDIDPSRVRVFYGGGRELPPNNSTPRPEFREIPIQFIDANGNGVFDGLDLFVFYADGVDSWEYDSTLNNFIRYKNHYTSKNVFWLTIDGNFSGPAKRYPSWDGNPNGAYDVSTDSYTAMFNKEEDILFWKYSPIQQDYNDYFEWYWASGKSFSTSAQLYDVVSGGTAEIIVRHRAGNLSLTVNSSSATPMRQLPPFSIFSASNLRDGLNSITLQSVTNFYTDYINILYPRWLRTIDGNLRFSQPDTFGVVRYNLTNVDSDYLLLDISDKMNPVKIAGGSWSGQNLSFLDTVSAQSHKQYYISNKNRFKTPSSITTYQIDNLKDVNSSNNRADEIILTYDGFYDQAVRLAQHRQNVYGLATRIVKISDVYNQFSYGLLDAIAIRDFLKYAYENWQSPAPSYVVLLGDGNYDYRNYMGSSSHIYIPPYEYLPLFGSDLGMSDELFVYFGSYGNLDSDSNSIPDMMIGRISARSVQDASEMIDKIIDYDSNPDLGPWRNRVVVAADDNLHPPHDNDWNHTAQAEDLANHHVPNSFETGKIYLIEYPMGAGGEKPQAREALMSAYNQGSLIIDWIGHGSAGLWADEHIFRRIEDIPRLHNGKRLSLVFTASCSIGAFDFPAFESMAEELARTYGRGAIAVISATRGVYATSNGQFNNAVFDQLLNSDSVGIGAAMYIAKFLRQSGDSGTNTNDRVYVLFGDPAQLLQFPKYKVRFNSVPDSLAALTENEVSGEITDVAGNIMSDFNGTVWVSVKDGATLRSVALLDRYNNPISPPQFISFIKSGATIFHGPTDVVNGHFTGRFFTPKDISYGSADARIYAYGENGVYDAVGVADSLRISGSMPTDQDSTGPVIHLFVDGRPFRQEITQVPSAFVLTADITDDHGVNITGQLGHGIVLSIDDGRVLEMDITGNFSYGRGNYQGGVLTFQTPELPLGQHTLSLKAWDNFNNSTLTNSNIEVVSTQNLAISNVMNYPNPVKGIGVNTSFQYCLNENVDKIIIKIFTEAGRKIKTLEFTSPDYTQMDCHQVDWNLRDGDGDPIADGIYLYKVIAEKQDGNGSHSEADDTRKLVILR